MIGYLFTLPAVGVFLSTSWSLIATYPESAVLSLWLWDVGNCGRAFFLLFIPTYVEHE